MPLLGKHNSEAISSPSAFDFFASRSFDGNLLDCQNRGDSVGGGTVALSSAIKASDPLRTEVHDANKCQISKCRLTESFAKAQIILENDNIAIKMH